MTIYLMIAAIWFAIGIATAVLLTIWPPRARQHSNVVHLASYRASAPIGQSSSNLHHQRQVAANK